MNEMTVILKDSDRIYKQKFLIYEKYELSDESPIIQECISEAKKNFDGRPEHVQIKIHMEM